ncbi:transporter substrate-binding domain-containing protein [Enterococcus olivae]
MKKLFLTSLLAVAGVFLLAGCGSSSNEEGAAEGKTKIVAATSGVSNPFSYENDGTLTGFDVEVLRAIFEGLPEYDFDIQVTEFDSILNGLDNGRYQLGANNFSSNEERKEKYDFSLPIIDNPNVFVVRKSDDTLKSLEDLKDYKAVTEVGNSGATMLENYNSENPDAQAEIIYTEENFVKQFQDIETGKYDVRIISQVSAEKAIEEHGMTELKVVPFEDTTRDSGAYILFSKAADDEEFKEKVNDRLKEMYNDGTLKKISEEQLGGDFLPDASVYE